MTGAGDDRAALDRLCDRLRSASETRLARPDRGVGGVSVAEFVHQTATWAAARQAVTSEVPRLHTLASGDQLAVVGRDFLDWASGEPNREPELDEWRARVERLRASI
ncbi:MAG: hypothetical protein ABI720_11555 [Actinomycetes bacterium]